MHTALHAHSTRARACTTGTGTLGTHARRYPPTPLTPHRLKPAGHQAAWTAGRSRTPPVVCTISRPLSLQAGQHSTAHRNTNRSPALVTCKHDIHLCWHGCTHLDFFTFTRRCNKSSRTGTCDMTVAFACACTLPHMCIFCMLHASGFRMHNTIAPMSLGPYSHIQDQTDAVINSWPWRHRQNLKIADQIPVCIPHLTLLTTLSTWMSISIGKQTVHGVQYAMHLSGLSPPGMESFKLHVKCMSLARSWNLPVWQPRFVVSAQLGVNCTDRRSNGI